jgi:hypothetical protein
MVCWKWRAPLRYRSKFEAAHVDTLYSMLKRHYHAPFELVCVTDDPAGIRKEVRCVPLWMDYASLPSPHGHGNPSCYRRLKMFSREAVNIFGPYFVSMDLDIVITGDVTELFQQDYDFRMYGDTARGTPYNGSLIQHTAGTRPQLWETFDPLKSPQIGIQRRYIGSDQAWIGACLGPNEAKFTRKDGVYSWRNELKPRGGQLPAGAKIVVFHGAQDPWTPAVRGIFPWCREAYR